MALLRRHGAHLLRLAGLVATTGLLGLGDPALAQGAAASAPDGLDLSANMRLRYEAIDGQARPGFNDSDDLLALRTILTAQYKSGPIRLAAELYDSRAWLADHRTPISTNEVNTLELVQAHAAIDLPGALGRGTTVSLQGGRFLLNIGSRRLVAADDYRNTTNGYTGLKADIGAGRLRGTLVYVLPQVRLPDDLDAILDNRPRIDRESFDLVLWAARWPGRSRSARQRPSSASTISASAMRRAARPVTGRSTPSGDESSVIPSPVRSITRPRQSPSSAMSAAA
jgi:hypothetical protein